MTTIDSTANSSQYSRSLGKNPRHKGWLGELVKTFRFIIHTHRSHLARAVAQKPMVTVYGSAQTNEDHPYYHQGVRLGACLAENGFGVITGGGPGIMEAANRGAYENGGISVGCAIRLPYEQYCNNYLSIAKIYRYFFPRKLALARYSVAFIALPGGFGTLDELYEMATLVNTGQMTNFPIVLVNKKFWEPFVYAMRVHLVREGMITMNAMQHIHVCDSETEAVEYVKMRLSEIRPDVFEHIDPGFE